MRAKRGLSNFYWLDLNTKGTDMAETAQLKAMPDSKSRGITFKQARRRVKATDVSGYNAKSVDEAIRLAALNAVRQHKGV